jgi:predicted porin
MADFSLQFQADNVPDLTPGIATSFVRSHAFTGSRPERPEEVGIRNWGTGVVYAWKDFTFHGLITTVHKTEAGGAAAEISGGIRWQFTPVWMLSGEYMYMKGNAFLDNNHANQIGATLFYTLSKRTTVYLSSIYQRANEGAQAQISGITDPDGSSSGSSQAVVRVGIHTFF